METGRIAGMKYNPDIHHRRSIRLRGYDYSQPGAYFVTLCVQGQKCLFGNIMDGEIRLNEAGSMIQTVWEEIPAYYPDVGIDAFIIMPNHIHGIIIIVGAAPRGRPCVVESETFGPAQEGPAQEGPAQAQVQGQAQGPAPTGISLSDVVHRYKTMTTKRYADGVNQLNWSPFPGRLWQRNYWEHVIRNEPELHRIREYILNNPMQWESDTLNVRANLVSAPSVRRTTRESPAEYAMEAWMV